MQKKTEKYLIIFIILFLVTTLAVMSKNGFVIGFDNYISSLITNISSPSLDNFMLFITNFGGGILVVSVFVILAIFLLLKKKKYLFYTMAAAAGSSAVLNKVIKLSVERVRPISHLVQETDFSFPSGHSTISTILLLSSLFLIANNIKNKLVRIVFMIIVSILFPLIAFSRIYLSVHFASDVVAGILLGSICFLASAIIARKF